MCSLKVIYNQSYEEMNKNKCSNNESRLNEHKREDIIEEQCHIELFVSLARAHSEALLLAEIIN